MKTLLSKIMPRHTLLLSAIFLILCTTAAAFDTTADSGLLMLVSKAHTVSSDYVPEVVTLENINKVSDGMRMRRETANAFTLMFEAMKADGISDCNVISAYRSYAYQKELVDTKVANRVANGTSRQNAYNQVIMSTAPAGASEHQLGLALDFSVSTYSSVTFAGTAAGKWLDANSWKYGFIRRYDGSKADLTGIVNEAWHFRYVGIPHAQIMVENGWCFEEYIDHLRTNGSYTLMTEDMTYTIYATDDETAEFNGIIDISRDNLGGWIITTSSAADPLSIVRGSWSEASFQALQDRGVTFSRVIDPKAPITVGQFAHLCGLEIPENEKDTLKREDAAAILEPSLPDKVLTYLTYSDLSKVSGNRFQSLQIAVTNGIFSHTEGTAFRPTDNMTWAEAAVTALRYLELTAPIESETIETNSETTANTDSEVAGSETTENTEN